MVEETLITDSIYNVMGTIMRSKAQSPDANKLTEPKKGDLQNQNNLQNTQKAVLADDEIRAFFSILRDAVVGSGYEFIGEDSEVKKAISTFKKLKFRKKNKRIVFDALSLLHAYVELEKDLSGNVIALNIPDATSIYPELDWHGKVLKYKQNVDVKSSSSKNYVSWSVDEMLHFTIDESTADYYGVSYIDTLKRIIELKNDILDYISYLFKYNMFRVHYHNDGVSVKDAVQYVDMLESQYKTNSGLVITAGTSPIEGHRYLTEDILLPLIQMLNTLRNRILTLIRVPPIIAGTVDNSNRSNSDIQADVALKNRIVAIQEDLEDDINFDLLPLLGLDNDKVEFRYKNNNIDELAKVNNILIGLLNAGSVPKETIEFIKGLGYGYPTKLFPENIEQTEVTLDKNSTLHESRKPQDNFDDSNYGKLSKDEQ